MAHTALNERTCTFALGTLATKIILVAALAGSAPDSFAQALFVEPVGFKVTQSCDATKGIHSRTGVLRVRAGETFQAFGENAQSGGTHVYIATPGSRRWLPLSCGAYETTRPTFRSAGADSTQSETGKQACLPFFDNVNNPVKLHNNASADITPVPPEIDAFGKAVNQMCGPSGKITDRSEFVKLMRTHPNVLADLMQFTGGKVFGNRPATKDQEEYLQDLVKAWYDVHAFNHIFCGETEAVEKIGGLHYHGRYQQLQTTGEACRLPNFKKNEVTPGSVYSMGVRMKKANGKWISHEIKGFGLTLSAADILKAATKALAENPTSSTESVACLQQVKDGSINYTTVFVRRQAGIRTFYPDATPDTAKTQSCKAALVLN